mmetsp:Transcript_6719/g.11034  ORF Transcript_6719/g.11034 Transcript_6719/m.11034 type:complete len:647 (+) Transcript_6719:95-2035(+)
MLESDLNALKRKELQVLAKKYGLKANMKSTDLIVSLQAIFANASSGETDAIQHDATMENSSNTVDNSSSTPILEQEVVAEIKVGAAVNFIDEGGTFQEGAIKRINKNSYRIKLLKGKEVTVPKFDVQMSALNIMKNSGNLTSPDVVVELFNETASPEILSAKSPLSASSSTKKKKSNKKKSLSTQKPSRPSAEITISPIKRMILSSTPPGTEGTPQPLTQQNEIDDNEGTDVPTTSTQEEEQLIIDEDYTLNIPKKKKKSSTKKKISPKKDNMTIAASSLQASKKFHSATKRVKQPSIVPKTTATMRARADAISKKKQCKSELIEARTPCTVTESVHKKSLQSTPSRSKCTIDSSIIDKINQSSRRFSSSWSSSKPRKSLSAFSESVVEKAAPSSRPNVVVKQSTSTRKTMSVARPSTASVSKTKTNQQASVTQVKRSMSAVGTRPAPMHVRKQLSSSGTSRSTASFHPVDASSKPKAKPVAPSVTSSPGASSTKKCRLSPKKVTKPNPTNFLKRSSGMISSRAVATQIVKSQSIAIKNSNQTTKAPTTSQHKALVATQGSTENPKPFKARPAPNFSKLHQNIFKIDRSVVNMVKENKQNAVGEKMTKAVSDAFGAPTSGHMAKTLSSKRISSASKSRSPLSQIYS